MQESYIVHVWCGCFNVSSHGSLGSYYMKYEYIYFKLPVFLQNILVNIQGLRLLKRRFGGDSEKIVRSYLKSDISKVDKLKLAEFLINAQRSPFWNKRFAEYGVNLIGEVDPLREVAKLPVLTKQEVRNNWNDIALLDDPTVIESVTSGSTGTALKVIHDVNSERHQWAVWERDRRTHGVGVGTWMGWFGGKPIVPKLQNKPPYWRVCYPLKQIMFSIDHLNDKTITSYFNKVNKAKLPWLHGYPSQLTLFASLIKKNGLGGMPSLKLVTTGSESLLPHQKQLMEEVFNVPVRQCYGLAEGVAAITEDTLGRFVVNQDFAYVELLPLEQGGGHERRIVGTNYNNSSFPLIRYFTGDVATVGEGGRVVEIDGRMDDYISLPDGRKIGRLYQMFKATSNISEAQVYQSTLTSITLRIVKSNNYTLKDEELILEDARRRFGEAMNVSVEYFDSIPKTRTGKLRLVVSDL